jgi:hypothetical protein
MEAQPVGEENSIPKPKGRLCKPESKLDQLLPVQHHGSADDLKV